MIRSVVYVMAMATAHARRPERRHEKVGSSSSNSRSRRSSSGQGDNGDKAVAANDVRGAACLAGDT